MKMRKRFFIAFFVAAMLLSCVSCSNTQSPSNNNPNSEQIETPDGLSRTIVIAQDADILSLDPHGHNSIVSGNVTRMLYDTLIRIDENNEFVPMLAESWEYLDKNTVQIKLRANVPFHDGHILTSEDVKFSLEREMQSSFSQHLLAMITEIEIIDELTLNLHVTDDSAALLSSLAHQCSSIIPKEYTEQLEAEGKSLSDSPCGTGPYKLDHWTIGTECEIVQFDDYYDEAYAAKNAGLRFVYIAEDSSRVIALETGTVDMVLQVPSADVSRLEGNGEINLLDYASCDLHYIALNSSKAPFDNELLRQAVACCIDRDAIIQVVCNGNAVPAYAPLGVAAIGYSEPDTIYEYDIERAKELLAQAGYENGFEFSLIVSGDDLTRMGQIIQASCKEAGITLNLESMEYSAQVDICGSAQHEAAADNWTANAEPDNTFAPWFTKSLIGTGGYNWSCYEGDEIENLMKQANLSIDMDERLGYYEQLNDFVSEHALVLPVYSMNGMVATRSNVDGLVLSSMDMHLFQFVTVSE